MKALLKEIQKLKKSLDKTEHLLSIEFGRKILKKSLKKRSKKSIKK